MNEFRLSAGVVAVVSVLALLAACSGRGDEDDTPPPPRGASTPPTAPTPTPTPTGPPPPSMVTVVADSSPRGAVVTGGGRQLGVTPLQTQVPIPAAAPGQVQTFAFTFQLEGHQTATINASPVNGTISITAALAPVMAQQLAVQPQEVGGAEEPSGGREGNTLRVSGQGGGRIYDHHTTSGSAVVNEPCVIDRLGVTLNGHHSYFGDLYITLRDPSGNSYSLARGGRQNPFRSHTVRRARGRQAQGRWTLAIEDRLQADSGNLNGWSMRIDCR